MLIPYQQLKPETLLNLIADFVSRDGTDNGDDSTKTQKIGRVENALQSGDAVIYFNAEFAQCILAKKSDVPKEMLVAWAPEATR